MSQPTQRDLPGDFAWTELFVPAAPVTRLLLHALLASGCGQLTGIDAYEVGEPRVDNPCSALEVVLSDGRCERVGVTACPGGFADDQAGGCTPILPETPCDSGQRRFRAT